MTYARPLYLSSGPTHGLLILFLLAALGSPVAATVTPTPTPTPLPTRTPNPLLDRYCAYIGFIDHDPTSGAVVSNAILVASGAIIGSIPVSGSPQFIAKSPDESTLYVTLGDDRNPINEIAVIDTATNTVTGSIPIDSAAIAFAPDGTRAYALCLSRQRMPGGEFSCPAGEGVSVIDTATLSVVGTPISLGAGTDPWSIAVSPDGTRAYVGNAGGPVSVVDLAKRQVVDSVPVGRRDVAVSPDGHDVFVAQYTGRHPDTVALEVIDVRGDVDVVKNTIPICKTDPLTDVEPDEIVVSPDSLRIYVACSSGVDVINSTTGHVILTVAGIGGVDSPPNGIALTPDGSFLYGSESGDCLQPLYSSSKCPTAPVLDTATNSVLATIFQGLRGTEQTRGIAVTGFPCHPVSGPHGPCVGDCDNSGGVTVDELITMVNIALGNAQPSACAHGVPSGAEVDIALIIQAVNNALTACPS